MVRRGGVVEGTLQGQGNPGSKLHFQEVYSSYSEGKTYEKLIVQGRKMLALI